jgi:uncharacterized protein
MSLKERLTSDLKEAMKNREQIRKDVVTMIRSDIKQAEVDKRMALGDEEIVDIISRQMKQRKDAIEEFQKGAREDLVEQTRQEIDILLTYLPEQMSEEEIVQVVNEAIEELGANSLKDMGKVMASVISKTKGRADGKIVNQIVKQRLQ